MSGSKNLIWAIVGLGTVACVVADEAAALETFTGQPIVDLIAALREDGRRIVYNRDLLPARLAVTLVPDVTDDFEALRAILAPHGLDANQGPNDTWLIVRSESAPGTTDPTLAAAPAPAAALIPPTLETVIVTTSRYAIERRTATSANTIGRHTLDITPALGQDPLRVTHRLPGITSNQLSSQSHIRGGNLDEVLLLLDGVRLYSPYHLKDFQNVFSSLNPHMIEAMDVRTGGFEARFGDRMSGVIDMQSVQPEEFRHHELGLSLLETSVLSSGLFGSGRGSWITSLRRGNLDLLSGKSDSDIGTPQYVDFFNKVSFDVSSRLGIDVGMLSLDDSLTLKDSNKAAAKADYDDAYLWLAIDKSTTNGLESSYRLATTNLGRTRLGSIDDSDRVTGTLSEESEFDQVSLAADWSFPAAEKVRIEWGLELSQASLDHRFESTRSNLVTIAAPDLGPPNDPPAAAQIELNQNRRSAYFSARYRPIGRLTLELGAHFGDQSLIDESQTDPRLNLLFDIGDRTSLRAAWGKFSQSDSLDEIALADGMLLPRPAQQSKHFIFGVEHSFGGFGMLRAEFYEKHADRVGLRFENLFERVSLLPELLPDRFSVDPISNQSRGFEISIEEDRTGFSWWANIAFSRTQDSLPTGRFRRSWDDNRSYKLGSEWSGQTWTVTANLSYRSGWPISTIELVNGAVTATQYNASRLADFSSLDVRANRDVATKRGTLNWFIEVTNLFDHQNYCCVDYGLVTLGSNPPDLRTDIDALVGIVPNIGIRWQF